MQLHEIHIITQYSTITAVESHAIFAETSQGAVKWVWDDIMANLEPGEDTSNIDVIAMKSHDIPATGAQHAVDMNDWEIPKT